MFNQMSSRSAAGAALLCLLVAPVIGAGPDQIGTFTGTLKSKGLNPLTGDKISTKSVATLQVAADNSTTLTVDGANFRGHVDNSFSATKANLLLFGPGNSLLSSLITYKGTSIKGTVQIQDLTAPFAASNGKLKLKNTSTSAPVGLANGTFTQDVNTTVPDGGTLFQTLFIPDIGIVRDVNVVINATHSFTTDFDIFLTSPSGTTVTLTTDNGSNGDNFTNTIFDDDNSTRSITSVAPSEAPFTGRFRPEDPLYVLDGQPSAGNWVLTVTDDFVPDEGSLQSWTLQINSEPLTGF